MTSPTDLVLLLPGWGTPAARLVTMSDALDRAGAVARVWSYTPQGSFDELVDAFGTAAEATRDLHDRDDRLHLVGHSLGGIIAAATALRRLRGDVASVTTINSPWRGTWVSYTGTGPIAQGLRWGSPLLEQLRAELAADLEDPSGPRWLLVATAGDLATPVTTSLAGVVTGDRLRRRVVAATGHSVSLTSPRLIAMVQEHVLDTPGAATPDQPDVVEA